MALFDEVADRLADHRRASLPTPDDHLEANITRGVAAYDQADIVDLDRGAVVFGTGHRDLEFTRQEREFGVQARPLANDLAIDPRVLDLVRGGAGEMIGGDIADAVARSLHRVHLDFRQIGEDRRHVFQARPVVLDILPGGEMAVIPPSGMPDSRWGFPSGPISDSMW